MFKKNKGVVVIATFIVYFFAMAYSARDEITSEKKNEDWLTLVQESYLYGIKGEYWKSIELAQRALKINPRSAEAWRLIGNAYELLGDEMEESGDYKKAEEYHKKAAEAWNNAKKINPKIIIPFYHE